MIKLATYGRDRRKDIINKFDKSAGYNTVAFNAYIVANGDTPCNPASGEEYPSPITYGEPTEIIDNLVIFQISFLYKG